MALTTCPHCGRTISDMANICPNCGHVVRNIKSENGEPLRYIAQHKKTPVSSYTPTTSTPSNTSERLKIWAIVFSILASLSLGRGLYLKNVYENSEYSYIDNVNSYVGGDAYNYIINGTYFAGFMALSGALYICATGLFCTSLLINHKDK